MPFSEGLEGQNPTPPGGLQNPLADGIIIPSEREEVVIVPLYGIINDSPLITAGQIGVRKLRKKHVKSMHDADLVVDFFSPILNRIQDALDKAEEQKKNKRN